MTSGSQIYLDFNASTPIAPEVIAAMREVLDAPFGNPSSDHWAGIPARNAVQKARTAVAGLLDCEPGEVVFTSEGSEANNHALKGMFFAGSSSDNDGWIRLIIRAPSSDATIKVATAFGSTPDCVSPRAWA